MCCEIIVTISLVNKSILHIGPCVCGGGGDGGDHLRSTFLAIFQYTNNAQHDGDFG